MELFRSITCMALLGFCGLPCLAETLGSKPAYFQGALSRVQNEQAITSTIWSPGLEDGFIPQGITYFRGTIYVATYQSTDPKVGKGPCRVYGLNATTGETDGWFDMPEDCTHAGGLVMLDEHHLLLSDTRILFKIDLARALEAKNASGAIVGRVRLKGLLKGSFVDFDGQNIWIGSSEKEPEKARAYSLPPAAFSEAASEAIAEDAALQSLEIPTLANGMAFDLQGRLWIAASNSKAGSLSIIDKNSGKAVKQFATVVGIEDLAFDEAGMIWSASEAGTRRWLSWKEKFPVVFRMDPGKLR